jgi:hypothetical protein
MYPPSEDRNEPPKPVNEFAAGMWMGVVCFALAAAHVIASRSLRGSYLLAMLATSSWVDAILLKHDVAKKTRLVMRLTGVLAVAGLLYVGEKFWK